MTSFNCSFSKRGSRGSKRCIGGLVPIHQCLAAIVVLLTVHLPDDPDSFFCIVTQGALFGDFYCQAYLLGFWFAFASTPVWKKLIGFFGGNLLLWALLRIGTLKYGYPLSLYKIALHFSVCYSSAVMNLLSRRRKTLTQDVGASPIRYRLRFSIRTLMICIAACAAFIEAVLILRSIIRHTASAHNIVLCSLSYIIIGWTSSWAALECGHLMPRLALFLISFGSTLAFDVMIIGNVTVLVWHVTSSLVTCAVLVLSTFLVLRWCDYRLVAT